MTPAEFIDRLNRHYSKRHESAKHQTDWLKEMVDCVRGTDPQVLIRAFELIRDEHEERAFPLPATIKKYISRAGDQVYPESLANRGLNQWGTPRAAHVDPKMSEIYAKAAVWQRATLDQYGSWANHWKATRHMRKGSNRGPKYAPKLPELPAAFKAAKLRRVSLRSRGIDTNRIVFEAMQERSESQHLHRELSPASKRMTGDRT